MTTADKYTKRAQELMNEHWDIDGEGISTKIASALERVALEARIDELDADWSGSEGFHRKRLGELRARLAKLTEGKDAKI